MNITSFAGEPTQGRSRRDALFGLGTGLGSIALTALLAVECVQHVRDLHAAALAGTQRYSPDVSSHGAIQTAQPIRRRGDSCVARVGQAFQPDSNWQLTSILDRVSLERLTYVD